MCVCEQTSGEGETEDARTGINTYSQSGHEGKDRIKCDSYSRARIRSLSHASFVILSLETGYMLITDAHDLASKRLSQSKMPASMNLAGETADGVCYHPAT